MRTPAIACLLLASAAHGAAELPVSADLPALDGAQTIGKLIGEDTAPSGFVAAAFQLDPKYAFLLEWYRFRWVNVLVSSEIADGTPPDQDSVIGALPGLDPQGPGSPQDEDDEPFYYTLAEALDFDGDGEPDTPTNKVPVLAFGDNRSDFAGGVLHFKTFLVLQNVSDPSLGEKDVCILGGFAWEAVIPPPGGQGIETITGVFGPSDGDVLCFEEAVANAIGGAFNGWTASLNCALSACDPLPVPLAGDLNTDGSVNSVDLNRVLGSFSQGPGGDTNGDGLTDSTDLNVVLGSFGQSQTLGACCFDDGTCLEGLDTLCAALGGAFQGEFSVCGDGACPSVRGACCLFNGSCVEDMYQEVCEAPVGVTGVFAGAGVTCDETECETLGACCISPSECELSTQDDCEGPWFAVQFCEDVTCPGKTLDGGCCVQSGGEVFCFETDADTCDFADGVFLGNGTPCGDGACDGAFDSGCCLGDSGCVMATELECVTELGGQWGQAPCDTIDCVGPAACCLPGGSCLDIHRADCALSMAKYLGIPCAEATCIPYGPCCLVGECFDLPPQVCVEAGGIPMTGGCSSADCPE